MKTIKQIADELRVSKQTIRNTIAKLGLQNTLQKNGNTFAIDEQQEMLIKQDITQILKKEVQSDVQNDLQNSLQSALRLLEKQNEQLSGELEIKNKQIEELTATIRIQAQSINAAHHNELAETIGKEMLSAPTSPKIGLWKRLFKRKNNQD